MRLSTKGRYGARFMLDLALHYANGPVPLRDTARRQDISEKYLWNLIGPLKSAGLIRSVRGSYGGYTITRSPSKIDMNDIVRTLEGPLCLVDCVDDPSVCERVQTCVTRDLWSDVSESVIRTLESSTLQDMVDRYKNKVGASVMSVA